MPPGLAAAAAAAAASTSAPAWAASLARAIEHNGATPAARYLQLATVRPDGRPAVRTVVFRGLRPGVGGGASRAPLAPPSPSPSPALAIVTDGRTSKVAHLAANPAAEAAWYFPETREQFRLAGSVAVVGAASPDPGLAAARSEVWAGLSPGVREWHAHPAPGTDRTVVAGDTDGGAASGPAAEAAGDARATAAAAAAPPPPPPSSSSPPPPPHEHFTLLLLDVDAVDHVDLAADTRAVWTRGAGGEWTVREVWP